MKVYVIVFNDLELAVDKVYTDREQAEKEMRRLIEATDEQCAEAHLEGYSHFYGIDELELVFGEAQPITLEEVYEL